MAGITADGGPGDGGAACDAAWIVLVIKNAIKSRTHTRAFPAAPPLQHGGAASRRSMPYTPQPCRPGQTV
ncbi:MAG: hypothetical protein J4G04_08650, partial [Nitrosopumilaceae archaeon]|nr:hypothetical protein [Nitrosopumilaceae archaeon]